MTLPTMLLLTEHFPYGNAEPFLETELPYLARHFAVHLLPTSVHRPEYSHQRMVPENVSVAENISKRISYSFGAWAALLLKKPILLKRILRLLAQEWKHVPRSIWAVRRLIRFTTQAVLVADQLLKAGDLRKVDVYYSYWLSSNALSIVLCKEAGRRGCFVSRAHRGDLYTCLAEREYQPYRLLTIGSLDRVICISEHGRRYLNDQHPGSSEILDVSRLGVRASINRTKAGYGEALHILSCSQLRPVKRIGLLVDSLQVVGIPVVWTHLGGGGLEPSLRLRAERLPDNISWHISGPISNPAVLEFLQDAVVDLFVNVSRSEGVPVSIMEAMSYGVPILATDVGGTAELVDDSNGCLISADISAIELAEMLEWYHSLSMEEKEAKREAAWKTWSREADADKLYSDFSLYLLALCS